MSYPLVCRNSLSLILPVIRRFIFSTGCNCTTLISNTPPLPSPSPNQTTTLNYLIDSCGLSPESALKASKQLLRKPLTPTNPDLVLSLFRAYGITQPQISRLISHNPSLLLAKTDKTLKPKLDFFSKICNVGELICRNADILNRSLDKEIIPSINFFRSLSLSYSSIAIILSRGGWLINNAQEKLGPKIAVLQEHGVPESNILKFVVMNPRCIRRDSERFKAVVSRLNKMGVDPSNIMFVRCLSVLLGMKQPSWDANMAVYRSFGWSEDEVISVFKKQPHIMGFSVKKINLALDFLMNSLKWTQGNVAKYASVVCLSLENRLIPRGYVLQILLSKDLIKRESMGTAFKSSEAMFMKKFVVKYQHEVPDLLVTYQNKMSN